MQEARWIAHLPGGQTHARRLGPDDEEIASLASRQHGIAARRQLLDLGIGARAIDHRLARGRLRRLYPGVYAVGHEAIPFAGRALAAVISVAPGVASHWTAAAMHGLIDPPVGILHATAIHHRAPRTGIATHRAALPPGETEIVAGVPTTTIPRTLLDLSGRIGDGRLRRLVKQAQFLDLTDVSALEAILDRHPRRRGRRSLARIIHGPVVGAGRTRSELEDLFLEFCARRSVPMPETNVPFEVSGRRIEVDCVWPGSRLIVELDSRRAHGDAIAFEEDRARDRSLTAAGWSPMRVTWAQLRDQGDALEAEIRAALARGAAPTHLEDQTSGIAYTAGA